MPQGNPWCHVCCTQHAQGGECPGNLLATGPERHARRFSVSHDNRLEYYGVLIAETGEHWRARIFTYPNMFWSVPGARGTVKFCGSTAGEAEELAIEFLREHCEKRRYTLQDATDEALLGQVDQETSNQPSPQGGKEERHPCKVPIRFGEERALQAATTANLSEGGVYVATDRPIAKGKRIRMMLDVHAYKIPLVGTVAWVRLNSESGKPKGMGVQVHNPPALFQRYVAGVLEQMAEIALRETQSAGSG